VLLVNGIPVSQTEFASDPFNSIRESHIPTLLGSSPAVVLHDSATDVDLAALPFSANVLAAGSGGYARHWLTHLPLPRREAPALPRARTFHVICGSLHPASLRQAECARRLPKVTVAAGQNHELPQPLPDALIIFGGDTAYATLTAMGVEELTPLGEVLPGVPVSHAGTALTVITKAGGFGEDHLVALIQEKLHP
jgi:uncharacterized protein YgbK (DUF1537 family)